MDTDLTNGDHRARVAASRRERMRMRLIDSALHVFADKGVDATDIKDVIEAAGVSRGSFYNYFQTNEELMGAVLEVLGNELLQVVDAVVVAHEDPALRVASGIRMVLRVAAMHPLLARFTARVGIQLIAGNSLAMQYLPRDISAGVASGQFQVSHPIAALAMALGATHAAICAMTLDVPLPEDFAESVALQVLMGLGLGHALATTLVKVPLEPVSLPPHALLARTLKLSSTPLE